MENYYIVDFHVVVKEIQATNSGFAKNTEKTTISFVKVFPHKQVFERFVKELSKFLERSN